ncbi:MAG: PIG-L family deacetylase [Phycisphaerae bacterium]|nr:PIG-L family deacetylase [Phycisphaerae bacterium]
MTGPTRRDVLGGTLAAGVGLPLAGAVGAEASGSAGGKARIVVVGGHPDDPESGCGGTIARYSDLGHEVVCLYLTRGEAGIHGKTHEQAAKIRTAEAEAACGILKARPVFAGQIDGATEVNAGRYEAFAKVLAGERPDIVLTHWPVDGHRDHRVASLLTYDAWERCDRKFALYYYEVMTGHQSQLFGPTDYVDITETEARKRAACMAHASQHPEGFYAHHDAMNRFRGLECRCKYGEAFVRHVKGVSPLGQPGG